MKGLRELAELLLEREVIFSEDLERIFGKRKADIKKEKEASEVEKAKNEKDLKEKEKEQTSPAISDEKEIAVVKTDTENKAEEDIRKPEQEVKEEVKEEGEQKKEKNTNAKSGKKNKNTSDQEKLFPDTTA
jgi:cell division protease FtsH